MPFRKGRNAMSNSRQRLVPIQSFRQILDKAITVLPSTIDNTQVLNGTDTDDIGFTNTAIPTGSQVYRIRVVINARGAGGSASGDIQWYLAKLRSGQTAASFPAPNALGGSAVRNQVFHNQHSMYATEDGHPYHFDRWLKIPKIYHRVRDGDQFFVKVNNPGTSSMDFSLHVEYKAYR